jgi:hypothetical protein
MSSGDNTFLFCAGLVSQLHFLRSGTGDDVRKGRKGGGVTRGACVFPVLLVLAAMAALLSDAVMIRCFSLAARSRLDARSASPPKKSGKQSR